MFIGLGSHIKVCRATGRVWLLQHHSFFPSGVFASRTNSLSYLLQWWTGRLRSWHSPINSLSCTLFEIDIINRIPLSYTLLITLYDLNSLTLHLQSPKVCLQKCTVPPLTIYSFLLTVILAKNIFLFASRLFQNIGSYSNNSVRFTFFMGFGSKYLFIWIPVKPRIGS